MSQNLNLCLSGGAEGADILWGQAAELAGHEVVHWVFETYALPKNHKNYVILDDDHLSAADPYLTLANKSIKRRWPATKENINNLLRRNHYQVHWSERVYAISSLIQDNSLLGIAGGTAWACQMYVDRWLHTETPLDTCELYLFDQESNQWLTWKKQWEPVTPPKPYGVYAGIGSRNLTDQGRRAILDIYGCRFNPSKIALNC